jgi:para-aminobenzoate synthetase/4-amino-4-deoxychorismate lyase
MLVVLDSSSLMFGRPLWVIRARRPDEVPEALAAMEAARRDGRWLAGWLGYELGYALESRLSPLTPGGGDLLAMGVYAGPGAEPPPARGRAYAGPLRPEWDRSRYGRAFAQVKDYIAAGDIYQANLSFRARFAFAGDPYALYVQLREQSGAPHCAYVEDGERHILSLSPELFFALGADGALTAKPMKGTMARGKDAMLAASAKDRAENLMIVDLIRNYLGRIAETGSVQVRDLFAVETYPTLHAMVSTVTALLRQGVSIAELLRALFPCGSVTGAPKIRAMEILRALEMSRRGAYCGAVGYFAPDGSARFNVAIRTLTICGGEGELGIGGGVVQDSREDSEYEECLIKARFFEASRRPLALIETLRLDGDFVRLESHLARMAGSARFFGLNFDAEAARRALAEAIRGAEGPQRVRLTLNETGEHRAAAEPLGPEPLSWTYAVSEARLDSSDLLLRHKTSWRDLYEREVARHAADEVLFLNERDELTEGARSNIFVRRDGMLLTPPLSSGLLDGRLRAGLIGQGACKEAVLTMADLAGEVFLGNSLRGLIPAVPAG